MKKILFISILVFFLAVAGCQDSVNIVETTPASPTLILTETFIKKTPSPTPTNTPVFTPTSPPLPTFTPTLAPPTPIDLPVNTLRQACVEIKGQRPPAEITQGSLILVDRASQVTYRYWPGTGEKLEIEDPVWMSIRISPDRNGFAYTFEKGILRRLAFLLPGEKDIKTFNLDPA